MVYKTKEIKDWETIAEKYSGVELERKLRSYLEKAKDTEVLYLMYMDFMYLSSELPFDKQKSIAKLLPFALSITNPSLEDYVEAAMLIEPFFFELPEDDRIEYLMDQIGVAIDYLDQQYSRSKYEKLKDILIDISLAGPVGRFNAMTTCEHILGWFTRRTSLVEILTPFYESLEKEVAFEHMLDELHFEPDNINFQSVLQELMERMVFAPSPHPVIKPKKMEKWKYPKPGILITTEDQLYIPIFSQREHCDPAFLSEMNYALLEIPFEEVVLRVIKDKSCAYDVVIDPFTRPVEFPREMLMNMIKKDKKNDEDLRKNKNKMTETTKEDSPKDNVIHLDQYR